MIYFSFFHVVAVLLAEPSDLYTGAVWISVVSVKRFLGCLPKWKDSDEWAWGLPVFAFPAIPGARHTVPLLGRWSLTRPSLWLCLGAALLVAVGGLPSAVGKGNSLQCWFWLFHCPMGERGRKAPELLSLGDDSFRVGQACSSSRAFAKVFLTSRVSLLPC